MKSFRWGRGLGRIAIVLAVALTCLAVTACGSGGGGGDGTIYGTLRVDSDFAGSVTIDGFSYGITPGGVTDFTTASGNHTCSSAYVSPTLVYVPPGDIGYFYAG